MQLIDEEYKKDEMDKKLMKKIKKGGERNEKGLKFSGSNKYLLFI